MNKKKSFSFSYFKGKKKVFITNKKTKINNNFKFNDYDFNDFIRSRFG